MLPAPLYRRIGALVYDFMLHAALWMIVAGLFTGIVLQGRVLAPEHQWMLQTSLFPMLVLVSYSFVSYFWLKNQQTLGMQAWKLKIVNQQGLPPTLTEVTGRFVFTVLTLGLGLVWCLFDRDKRALQDIFTPTAIVYCP